MPGAERGYTLIEVLVAVVVLSIGLLGLALLTGMGLQDNTRAYQRSIAVFLAYDIADRMRANPEGMWEGQYVDKFDPDEVLPQEPTCGTQGVCDPATRAAIDLVQWKGALRKVAADSSDADGLPQGSGSINLLTKVGEPPLYRITLKWKEPQSRGGAGKEYPPVCDGAVAGVDEGFTCFQMDVRP